MSPPLFLLLLACVSLRYARCQLDARSRSCGDMQDAHCDANIYPSDSTALATGDPGTNVTISCYGEHVCQSQGVVMVWEVWTDQSDLDLIDNGDGVQREVEYYKSNSELGPLHTDRGISIHTECTAQHCHSVLTVPVTVANDNIKVSCGVHTGSCPDVVHKLRQPVTITIAGSLPSAPTNLHFEEDANTLTFSWDDPPTTQPNEPPPVYTITIDDFIEMRTFNITQSSYNMAAPLGSLYFTVAAWNKLGQSNASSILYTKGTLEKVGLATTSLEKCSSICVLCKFSPQSEAKGCQVNIFELHQSGMEYNHIVFNISSETMLPVCTPKLKLAVLCFAVIVREIEHSGRVGAERTRYWDPEHKLFTEENPYHNNNGEDEFEDWWQWLLAVFTSAWQWLLAVLTSAWQWLLAVFTSAVDVLQWLLAVLISVWQWLLAVLTSAMDVLWYLVLLLVLFLILLVIFRVLAASGERGARVLSIIKRYFQPVIHIVQTITRQFRHGVIIYDEDRNAHILVNDEPSLVSSELPFNDQESSSADSESEEAEFPANSNGTFSSTTTKTVTETSHIPTPVHLNPLPSRHTSYGSRSPAVVAPHPFDESQWHTPALQRGQLEMNSGVRRSSDRIKYRQTVTKVVTFQSAEVKGQGSTGTSKGILKPSPRKIKHT